MLWSRFGMAKIEIFGDKDLRLLNKCMMQAGASQPVGYVCDPEMPFSCGLSYVCMLYENLEDMNKPIFKHDRQSNTPYTICGVPPDCLCISNATNNQYGACHV